MIISNEKEQELVIESAHALRDILMSTIDQIEYGMTTKEIDLLSWDIMKEYDVLSAPKEFYNFPSYANIAVNNQVAHGVGNDHVYTEEDVLKVDISIKHKNGYCADACRTIYGGTDSGTKKLIKANKTAVDKVVSKIKAGDNVSKIGKIIEDFANFNNIHIIYELQGHGIGKVLHEQPHIPNFWRLDKMPDYRLSHGEVVCIEPLFSLIPTNIVERDNVYWSDNDSITTHHEDVVLISEKGAKNLTKFV